MQNPKKELRELKNCKYQKSRNTKLPVRKPNLELSQNLGRQTMHLLEAKNVKTFG